MSSDRQKIVVGIIQNKQGDSILLSRRPDPVHQGNTWEFPGGKAENGESSLQALYRELLEEVNIQVKDAHRLITVRHDYPDRKIVLEAWIIDEWLGRLYGREGQSVEWVPIGECMNRQMPEANDTILKVLSLPPVYLITPDLESYDDAFLSLAEDLVRNGVQLMQFRNRRSSFQRHSGLVRELVEICDRYSGQLLYNGTPDQAEQTGAHGVHLSSGLLMQYRSRPMPPEYRVAVSCHNAGEIENAGNINADFCVLGPVHETGSHTGRKGIGWKEFSSLSAKSNIPVYALGGIQPAELTEARRNGAHGVAMISAVWSAADPIAAAAALCSETRTL